jgi:hypothetical protein
VAVSALACLAATAVLAYALGWVPELKLPHGSSPRASSASSEGQPVVYVGGGSERKQQAAGKRAEKAALGWLDDLEKKARAAGNGGLEIDLVDCAADKDGVYRLKAGQSIRLRIKALEAGFVGVWTVSPDGTVTQLFPSAERNESNQIKAGQTLLIPEDGDVEAKADANGGRERLLVLRSPRPFDVQRGEREGPYFVERQKQEPLPRSLARRPSMSSRVIPYEVAPE